jgi:hypothetical protein
MDYYRRGNNADSPVRILKAWFTDSSDVETSKLKYSESFSFYMQIESREYHPEICYSLTLHNENGDRAVTVFSKDNFFSSELVPGIQTIKVSLNKLPLSPGRYFASFGVNRNSNTTAFDVITDFPAFDVGMLELESGEIDWSHRPWGSVHWSDVSWFIIK